MPNVQCPNCGNFKVRARRFQVDVTGKRHPSLLGVCVLVGSATFIVSTLAAGSFFFLTLSALPTQSVTMLSLATSVAITSIVTALFVQNRYKVSTLTKPAGNFQCRQCSHRWYWSEGDPWPQYNGYRGA